MVSGRAFTRSKHVNERFAWRIGSLVNDHGADAVDAALKDYTIAVELPKNLHEAFGPTNHALPVAVRGVGIMTTKG